MDGADLAGVLVIGMVIVAGLASFTIAGLVGGAVASLAVRRGRTSVAAWLLVAAVATATGLVTLVGLIVVWGALEGVLGDVPLLYPAWVLSALSGAVSRIALSSRPVPKV